MGKRILVVGATFPELAGLIGKFKGENPLPTSFLSVEWQGNSLDVLCTGIGMVNTAWNLGRYLLEITPDHALQLGIGGGFPGGPDIGEVVEIKEECYPELGADSPEGFLGLKDMGFVNFRAEGKDYYNLIENPHAGLTGLRQCRGITVNRVHGTEEEISLTQQTWAPEVESMEGAAFMQACLQQGISFTEIRGISNRVEPRNRAAWEIPEAIAAVQKAAFEFLAKMTK